VERDARLVRVFIKRCAEKKKRTEDVRRVEADTLSPLAQLKKEEGGGGGATRLMDNGKKGGRTDPSLTHDRTWGKKGERGVPC